MSNPVPQFLGNFDLAAVRVGEPVSASHVLRMAQACAHLTGFSLQCVASVTVVRRAAFRSNLNGFASWSVPFVYSRHTGCNMLAIVVTLTPTNATISGQTVALSMALPAGASWFDSGGMDGSTAFRWPAAGHVSQTEIVGLADVTGLTPDTLSEWLLTVTPSATGIAPGIQSVHVFEVPRASLSPSLDDVWRQSAALAPNRLDVGHTGSGFDRFAELLDIARTQFRHVSQIATAETADTSGTGTNANWHVESATAAPIEWQYNASLAHDLRMRWQCRNLYSVGAGAPNTAHTLAVRYRTDSTFAGALDVYLTGASALAAQTFVLPATFGVWAWAYFTVTVPRDGVGGLVDCRFEALGGGGFPQVCFSAFAFIDSET